MKTSKIRFVLYSVLSVVSISVFGIVYAINTINTGFRTTTSEVVIDAHNNCKKVRHTGSQEYFVPTKSDAEWQAFRDNAPSDIEITDCVDRYPGCDTNDITVGSYTIAACNVGATTASTDWTVSGGGLFQWGRNKSFAYGDTSQQATQIAGSVGLNASTDTNNFVWSSSLANGGTMLLENGDWATTASPNTNNWGGFSGDNIARRGPCAPGYHVPLASEWQNIIIAGGWETNGDAMRTALQLPYAGSRGLFSLFGGSFGYYWSSSPNGIRADNLYFMTSSAQVNNGVYRANGFSVRCFKN